MPVFMAASVFLKCIGRWSQQTDGAPVLAGFCDPDDYRSMPYLRYMFS